MGAGPAGDDVVLLCFPCIKPSPSLLPLLHRTFFAASPERQGAGAAAKEDVAVEAMDRAALLALLQAIPRCSFHHLVVASRAQVSLTTLFSVMWTWPLS
jgi:hypothetical protein